MPPRRRRRVDRLPGGKGDRVQLWEVDAAQLRRGCLVEMEHTRSRRIACEIALDHLTEDPRYYTKLARVHLDGTPRPRRRR